MPKQPKMPDAASPRQTWQAFSSRVNAADEDYSAVRLSASLRYTAKEENSARVSALLWGNGNVASPYPLRLDLSAGIGAVVASIREDENMFAAYNPKENTLYTHPRGELTLVSFGVPIPLTLSDLTLLLTGHGGRVFLPADPSARSSAPSGAAASARGVFFPIDDAPLPGILEIDPEGAPLSWREPGGNGWIIEFEPDSENPLRPHKLRITHPEGYEAIIVVREITSPDAPYTANQMELAVPPGALRKSLEVALRDDRLP
jgi:hypothetical protein